MTNPLKGIRVLELGQFIAGPYAGLQLADLGATVIKVERPGKGDPFREFGLAAGEGYSHNFCAFNRNKLSLALDINSPRGQEAFRKLARGADVVLENFRSGVMQRLGLGHERLRADNPRLIYCSIAGFSADGPYRDRPAYDAVGSAMSGLLGLMVDPADPRILGPTISDQVSGMQACAGILGALYEREKSGKGARVQPILIRRYPMGVQCSLGECRDESHLALLFGFQPAVEMAAPVVQRRSPGGIEQGLRGV